MSNWPLSAASRLRLMAPFIKGTSLFECAQKTELVELSHYWCLKCNREQLQVKGEQMKISGVACLGFQHVAAFVWSSPTTAEESGFNGTAVMCHWSVSLSPAVHVCVRACACVCACNCMALKHLHFAFPNLWAHSPAQPPVWGKWEEQITTCLSRITPQISLLRPLLISLFVHTITI